MKSTVGSPKSSVSRYGEGMICEPPVFPAAEFGLGVLSRR